MVIKQMPLEYPEAIQVLDVSDRANLRAVSNLCVQLRLDGEALHQEFMYISHDVHSVGRVHLFMLLLLLLLCEQDDTTQHIPLFEGSVRCKHTRQRAKVQPPVMMVGCRTPEESI